MTRVFFIIDTLNLELSHSIESSLRSLNDNSKIKSDDLLMTIIKKYSKKWKGLSLLYKASIYKSPLWDLDHNFHNY